MNDDPVFTGDALVAFAPCGCWSAVQLDLVDLRERIATQARFMSEHDDVRAMTHAEWAALRNGVNGDLKVGCDHQPQWGRA